MHLATAHHAEIVSDTILKKQLSLKGELPEIMDIIGKLSQASDSINHRVTMLGRMKILALVLLVPFLIIINNMTGILTYFLYSDTLGVLDHLQAMTYVNQIGYFSIIVYTALIIWIFRKIVTLKKNQFADDLKNFIIPLLHKLRRDIKGHSIISVDVNLRFPFDSSAHVERKAPYNQGRYKCVRSHFTQHLCSIGLPLKNGSRLSIQCQRTAISISKVGGGKSKGKSKCRIISTLSTRLLQNDTTTKVNLKPKITSHKQSIRHKSTHKGTVVKLSYLEKQPSGISSPCLENMTENILQLYASLEPKRKW